VVQRLAEVHGQLYKKAMRSLAAMQVRCDKAIKMYSSAVGYRLLIYQAPGETESDPKLHVPWIGPYRITERHSAVAYSALSELECKTARQPFEGGTRRPGVDESEQGLWPDLRRVLRGVMSKTTVRDGVEYQVR
jgi:hypothetical protein